MAPARPQRPAASPVPEPPAVEEEYEEVESFEELFEAPPEGEGWDGSGGPPPGMEAEYAANAPLPPSKVREIAERVKQAGAPIPESVVRKRGIMIVAKRTVSTRDSAGTLNSRTYEVTLSEEADMTYEESRRILTVLTNDATTLSANYLGVDTEVREGRVVWAALPAAAATGVPRPQTQSAPPQRPSPQGSNGARNYSSNGSYTCDQCAVFFEDYTYDNPTDYWENFMDFQNKSEYAPHPSIKPKNDEVFRRIMDSVDPGQGPSSVKPVFVRSAPPQVQEHLRSRGIPIR